MKGMVFTEFLEMVEVKFSPEVADQIIEQANLRSGGIYTSVGTYDHGEMIELVSCLSKETGISPAELVRSFGIYLFGRFHAMFPIYFEGVSSSFGFLQRIEDLLADVHVLNFNSSCAAVFGQLRGVLQRSGITVPPLDLLIASVALANDLTLVTHNGSPGMALS